jgi:hypothetical protein
MKVSDQYNLNLFRTATGARAGWKCEICDHVGDDCQAHHIYSRDNKAVRYDPDNGLFVCDKCHRWTEIVGTKKVIEYLVCHNIRSGVWKNELILRKNMIVKYNDQFRAKWKIKLLDELKEAA